MSQKKIKIKPKRLRDLPKPIRDTLATWSAFRNLGFDADEIFFGFGVVSGEQDSLHLALKTQGKVFVVITSHLPGFSQDHVMKLWVKACKIMHRSTPEELEACYRDHLIGSNLDYFATFASAIREKGIVVPELIPFEGAAQA